MKDTNKMMLQGSLFPSIVGYTLPIILTSLLQLLFNAEDLVVGQFCGSLSVAAVGATGSITGLLVNFFIGLSVDAGVTVAHGLGSLMYSVGPALLSIYITDSAEAISFGMIRMGYMCPPYFLCGLMDVTTGALRGMGASFVPMLISVLGVCGVRITWIYTVFRMPQFHTPQCLYFSYAISWLITALWQQVAFLAVYRRHSRE